MPFEVARRRLLALVPSLAGRRIVVAGDFVLDRFVYGHPKRVSREAPVLILRFWKEERLPGGAGNTAANVRALGGVPLCVGASRERTRRDGRCARRSPERGIAAEGLVEVAGYRTPTKTRILGGAPHAIKQQIVRYDVEEPLARGRGARRRRCAERLRARRPRRRRRRALRLRLRRRSRPARVAPLRAALPAGARISVDSRHRLPEFSGVDAATPNEEELEECAGGPLGDSDAALEAAGSALRSKMRCASLFVTRGSRGMALFSAARAGPDSRPRHRPGRRRHGRGRHGARDLRARARRRRDAARSGAARELRRQRRRHEDGNGRRDPRRALGRRRGRPDAARVRMCGS